MSSRENSVLERIIRHEMYARRQSDVSDERRLYRPHAVASICARIRTEILKGLPVEHLCAEPDIKERIGAIIEQYVKPWSDVPTETKFGEIVGYRLWMAMPHSVATWGDSYRLHSLFASCGAWKPVMGPKDAAQNSGDIHERYTAGGYYAAKDTGWLLEKCGWPHQLAEDGGRPVIGSVEMWGSVVEHEHGYRAEYMRITNLAWLYERRRHKSERRERDTPRTLFGFIPRKDRRYNWLVNNVKDRRNRDILGELREFYLKETDNGHG